MERKSLDVITSWKVLVPAIIVIAVAVMAATFVAKSNTDYICTRIIEDETACAIDEWSDWTDIGNNDPEADTVSGDTYEVQQRRIGTGTKILSRVIQYINRRTACTAGFNRTGTDGSGGGDGGYKRGGKTFTNNAVCQIEESRTVTRTVDPEGDGDAVNDAVIGEVTSVETVGTTTVGGEQELDGLDAINEFRHDMIRAEISAVPALVAHYGDTTEIRWNSRETKSCSVSGDNGDSWVPISQHTDADGNIIQADTRTSGIETSGIINSRTEYTLTCIAYDDSEVTDVVVITRVPVVNEE